APLHELEREHGRPVLERLGLQRGERPSPHDLDRAEPAVAGHDCADDARRVRIRRWHVRRAANDRGIANVLLDDDWVPDELHREVADAWQPDAPEARLGELAMDVERALEQF